MSNHITTIEGFLSPEECSDFVCTIESIGFQTQRSGDGQPIRSRAQFEDSSWANLIWMRLKTSLPNLTDIYTGRLEPEPIPDVPLEFYTPSRLNERFRCYKYGTSEEFRRHQDFCHEYSPTERTFLTVLIYLNDGYSGGATTFDDCSVEPKLGMLAMFPHELEHEGNKIENGVKYCLRTDVIYAAKAR